MEYTQAEETTPTYLTSFQVIVFKPTAVAQGLDLHLTYLIEQATSSTPSLTQLQLLENLNINQDTLSALKGLHICKKVYRKISPSLMLILYEEHINRQGLGDPQLLQLVYQGEISALIVGSKYSQEEITTILERVKGTYPTSSNLGTPIKYGKGIRGKYLLNIDLPQKETIVRILGRDNFGITLKEIGVVKQNEDKSVTVFKYLQNKQLVPLCHISYDMKRDLIIQGVNAPISESDLTEALFILRQVVDTIIHLSDTPHSIATLIKGILSSNDIIQIEQENLIGIQAFLDRYI